MSDSSSRWSGAPEGRGAAQDAGEDLHLSLVPASVRALVRGEQHLQDRREWLEALGLGHDRNTPASPDAR
eukprot:10400994-Alexandrium_andersonii.AAC.1